jgi:hypothetical protein
VLERVRKFFSKSEEGGGLTAQQWVVVLLIGLASVLAAFFGWRAAAIGSTAAYDDRQSISESIKVEQRDIEVSLATAQDASEYVRYLGDYALAGELDNQAGAVAGAGESEAAASARRQADALRRNATERAAANGVFGEFSITSDLREPSPQPRPFSFEEQAEANATAEATAFDSAGNLDPQVWADDAESIRDRIEGLSVWTFVLLCAVLLLTIAQVNSDRRPAFYTFVTLGVVALTVGAVGGFAVDFFA